MFYTVVAAIARVVLKLVFRIKVYGKNSKIKDFDEGYIVCGNHASMLDPVLVAITHNNHIRYMAKKELYNNVFLKFILDRLRAFPVDREGNSLSAIKNSLKILRNNEILGIFPEGTRVTDKKESSAKGGISAIATKAKKKILPVYIDSNYKFFNKIDIYYGDFIDLEEYYDQKLGSEDYQKISEDIMERIYGLKEEFNEK